MGPTINTGTSAPTLEEIRGQGILNTSVQKWSNLGSDNPFKGPTARTLFYEAAKRKPGKYGQFLLYSFGNHENNFIDAYYRSENREHNRSISPRLSKNPSAGHLVRETGNLESVIYNCNHSVTGLTSNLEKSIVGGLSAPYYWKDFLFCKYYATIPNNYMITLRRFPTPVLDNLSVPAAIKTSGAFNIEGAARPVAQAVTWFGGNTGNKLNDLLSFSAGIKWKEKDQSSIAEQQSMTQGFINDGSKIIGDVFGSGIGDSGFLKNGKSVLESLGIAADPSNTSIENYKFMKFRELIKDSRQGAGLMGEYIWTSVDVVNKTHLRDMGLPFTWGSGAISVNFEYELTSVGEVNSKATMLDILGNLLSIGTNYGSFLTPDFRYNANLSAFGFPGGNKGLETFYKNPLKWFVDFGDKLTNPSNKDASADSLNRGGFSSDQLAEFKNQMQTLTKNANGNFSAVADALKKTFGDAAERLLQLTVTPTLIEAFQFPASILTGAPIGEWHLVIGNPCNPIAMIGNLICEGVKISFGEVLGPDDFPTTLKATFTLKHGRDRERGEIESIFNRGDGRLYQSSMPTTADSQSVNGIVNSEGANLQLAVSGALSGDSYGRTVNNQQSPGK